MQVAHVEGQIKMAEKIGENKEYQDFVIRQEQVKAMCEVGKEQARNLGRADIKIFANAGSVEDGVNNVGNVFNSKTGLNVGSLLEAFTSTPIGAEIADKVLGTGDTIKTAETAKAIIAKAKKKES